MSNYRLYSKENNDWCFEGIFTSLYEISQYLKLPLRNVKKIASGQYRKSSLLAEKFTIEEEEAVADFIEGIRPVVKENALDALFSDYKWENS